MEHQDHPDDTAPFAIIDRESSLPHLFMHGLLHVNELLRQDIRMMQTQLTELNRHIEQQDARLDRAGEVCLLMAERMNRLERELKQPSHRQWSITNATHVPLPSPAPTTPPSGPSSGIEDPLEAPPEPSPIPSFYCSHFNLSHVIEDVIDPGAGDTFQYIDFGACTASPEVLQRENESVPTHLILTPPPP